MSGRLATTLVLCFAFAFSCARRAGAEGRRIVVAIGSNQGLDNERPLTYAEQDAQRFADVMLELGGAAAKDVTLLTSPAPQRLLQALALVARGIPSDATLIVYFSGHGSESALHLRGQELPLAQLSSAVEQIPARLRLIVIDACRDAVAAKGFEPVEPFAISLRQAPQQRGVITIQSAGPGEAALESLRLQSGLFSHYLISGLRGAADRDTDGRVSIDEAYEFAYSRTLQQSSSVLGHSQHPTLRMDTEGAGPMVLTSLAPTTSLLFLPPGRDVHYVVFEKGSQSAFAEAWSESQRAVLVALPAGQFVVQRRSRVHAGVSEVTLPFGGTRKISDADFLDVPDEELTLRGGERGLTRQRVAAAFGLTLRQRNFGEGATLGYFRGASHWQLWSSIGLWRHEYMAAAEPVQREAFSLLAGVQYTEPLGPLNLRLGVALAGTVHRQEISSRAGVDQDVALGFGPAARAGLALPLAPWLDWELGVLGLTGFYREDGSGLERGQTRLTFDTAVLLSSGLGIAF